MAECRMDKSQTDESRMDESRLQVLHEQLRALPQRAGLRDGRGVQRLGMLPYLPRLYFTQSAFEAVLQKSTPLRIRQLILYDHQPKE